MSSPSSFSPTATVHLPGDQGFGRREKGCICLWLVLSHRFHGHRNNSSYTKTIGRDSRTDRQAGRQTVRQTDRQAGIGMMVGLMNFGDIYIYSFSFFAYIQSDFQERALQKSAQVNDHKQRDSPKNIAGSQNTNIHCDNHKREEKRI